VISFRHSNFESEGAMKKDMDGNFLMYPTKQAWRSDMDTFLVRLSTVKRRSWKSSHMCTLIF